MNTHGVADHPAGNIHNLGPCASWSPAVPALSVPTSSRRWRARVMRCGCLTRCCRSSTPAASPRSPLIPASSSPAATSATRRRRRRAARRQRGLPPGRDGRARRRLRRRAAVRRLQRPGHRGPARRDGPRRSRPARARLVHGRLRRGRLHVRPARARRGAAAPAGRRPRRRQVRAALRALRRTAVTATGPRGSTARAAQRLRRHQGRAGAPRRLLGQGDRRPGDSAALPQRVRPRDAPRHARTPGSPRSSAPPWRPAARRGSSRTAAQRRDFVHVRDVAAATVTAIEAAAGRAPQPGRAPCAPTTWAAAPRAPWASWRPRWPAPTAAPAPSSPASTGSATSGISPRPATASAGNWAGGRPCRSPTGSRSSPRRPQAGCRPDGAAPTCAGLTAGALTRTLPRHTSRPLTPGSIRSSTTRSGRHVAAISSAACPSTAAGTPGRHGAGSPRRPPPRSGRLRQRECGRPRPESKNVRQPLRAAGCSFGHHREIFFQIVISAYLADDEIAARAPRA